jgi:enterochelin esterase-like enzyme
MGSPWKAVGADRLRVGSGIPSNAIRVADEVVATIAWSGGILGARPPVRRPCVHVTFALVLGATLLAAATSSQNAPAAAVSALVSVIADVEAGRRGTPIVGQPTPDGNTIVTFLARRAGGRVPRIVSDVTGWGERGDGTFDTGVGTMRRVGRTDWYSLEASVAPCARIEYLIAYGVGDYRLDPHNPRHVGPPPASEFVTPGYEPPEELAGPPESLAGAIAAISVESRALGGPRRGFVYSPPGDRLRPDSPVAVFLDLRAGQIARVIDWLVARGRIEAPVAVFVDPHAEGIAGDREGAVRTFLAEDLPAWLASHRGATQAPGDAAIIAISFGAKDAVDAAITGVTGAFGRVGLLIPGRRIGPADLDAIARRPHPRLRVAMLAGRYDQANLATARALRAALAGAGDVVDYAEVPEGHSPRTWLNHLRFVLVSLFGPASPPGPRRHPAAPGDVGGDRAYRARDERLLARLADASARCAGRWDADAVCLTTLRQLRQDELQLFADVRAHAFTDLTESNYWHRGRLKFPSEIEQLLRRVERP